MHSEECGDARMMVEIILANGSVPSKAEVDRYERALEECPGSHPWH